MSPFYISVELKRICSDQDSNLGHHGHNAMSLPLDHRSISLFHVFIKR